MFSQVNTKWRGRHRRLVAGTVEDIRNVCNFINKDKHLSPFITQDFNDAGISWWHKSEIYATSSVQSVPESWCLKHLSRYPQTAGLIIG